jgi:methyl-accepting chemotaxis protein
LNYAIKIAEGVAAGDLTQKIENEHKDEVGLLLNALSAMVQTLSQILMEIRASTEQITSAASQIATGNMDLSSRTEMQASSLEETASSMEEMTSTVKQNADNARQANQLSAAAADVAQKGGVMINQVVEVMGKINTSSQKISDIIGVIDGIAFQTNILALNAAVEAARAGEQGRGFAVVASEVRNLAQRSASAAKDIKDLIGESVAQVQEGTKVVDQSGENMEKIVTSIKHVSEVVSEISIASQEQSSGIDQINIAITQMDETTQQNAALVEEAAAAATAMDDQARNLNSLVEKFKLEDERGNTFRANANNNANSKFIDRGMSRLH